jgi:hypothetical protein
MKWLIQTSNAFNFLRGLIRIKSAFYFLRGLVKLWETSDLLLIKILSTYKFVAAWGVACSQRWRRRDQFSIYAEKCWHCLRRRSLQSLCLMYNRSLCFESYLFLGHEIPWLTFNIASPLLLFLSLNLALDLCPWLLRWLQHLKFLCGNAEQTSFQTDAGQGTWMPYNFIHHVIFTYYRADPIYSKFLFQRYVMDLSQFRC